MPETDLNIILSVIDNASEEFKRINSGAIQEVNRLKGVQTESNKATSESVTALGNRTQEAGTKVKSFGEELKQSSRDLRALRQTLFFVTAAFAIAVKTTKDASEFNEQARISTLQFSTALKTLSVTLGTILSPAVSKVAEVIVHLTNVITQATAGAIKMISVIILLQEKLNLPLTGKDLFNTLKNLPNELKKLPSDIMGMFNNVKKLVTGETDPLGILETIQKNILEINNLSNRAAEEFLSGTFQTQAKVGSGQTLTQQEEATRKIKENMVKMAKEMEDNVSSAMEQVRGTITSNLSGAIIGISTFSEAWKSIWQSMATYLIKEVLDKIIAKLIAIQVLKKAIGFFGGLVSGIGGLFFHEGGEIQKKHSGGMIRAHQGLAVDEVPIIAQTGEGILSRRGMQALGGSGNLNRLNQGESAGGGGGISVNVYYPKMSTREEAKSLANILGLEIERQLRYAR